MAAKDGLSLAEEEVKVFSQGGRAASLKGSFLEVEKIANVVLFVASDLSSATNGAAVRAEGDILKVAKTQEKCDAMKRFHARRIFLH